MARSTHLTNDHPSHQRQRLSASHSATTSTQNVLQRAQDDPQSLGVADIQVLQRTIGNRGTARLLSSVPSVNVGRNLTQAKPVQRSLHGPEGGTVDQGVEQQINRAGEGRSLEPKTQSSMEQAFGADFSGVRVHTDQSSATLNRTLNAKAFTTGRDIFFGQGEYNPDSRSGNQLIAHELTHTLQQGGAGQGSVQASRRSFGTIQRKGGNETDEIKNIQQSLTPNFAPRSTDDPARFEVTIAVAQGLPEYLKFAKTRMRSTIRNKARGKLKSLPVLGGLVRDAKTSAQIKDKAAKKAAPKDAAGEAADADVNRIAQESNNVGHSWLKFSTYNTTGNLIGTYSFGFIPGQAPTNPQDRVPGYVRNPDLEYEDEASRRYQSTTVPAKKYLSGLRKATTLSAAPPNYSTIGYNCTQFVKDVGKAAGAAVPSKVGLIIPISNRGLFKSAANPNKLFDKLGDTAQTDSIESQMIGSKDYESDDNGMLVSQDELVKSWTADDVIRFLVRKQFVAYSFNEGGREKWEEEKLRDFHLELLSKEDIKEVLEDFDLEELHKLFNLMGVSTANLPAMRRRNPWDRW